MKSIFSVHFVLGIVDPQFNTSQVAELVESISKENDIPIGSGVAVVIPRPEPIDEEEESFQAITPGTHEVNLVMDFDPNDESFLDWLIEDTMCNRYNVASQLCLTAVFNAMQELNSVPTYFQIKITGDYIDDELYEKMRKHRFNL